MLFEIIGVQYLNMDVSRFHNDDKYLAKLLQDGDEMAWQYIFEYVVIPVSKVNKFYWIMHDKKISREDLLGMLFEVMIVKEKLLKFEGRCPLRYWMMYYVKGILLNICKEKKNIALEDDFYVPIDEKREELFDDWKLAERCFRELWKKNPLQAYVHLLRVKEEMSVEEIQKLLKISSISNVYQLSSRAVSDLKKIQKKILGEYSI